MDEAQWPPPWGQQPVPLPTPRQSLPGVVGVDWSSDVESPRRPARLLEWLAEGHSASMWQEPRIRLVAGATATIVLVFLLWVL